MEKFVKFSGLVAPIDHSNVDTDAVIPKQFLKSIHRTGFGPNLFDEWRYLDHGAPGKDNSNRPLNPKFVLNDKRYQGASVLLARENFGCGSSREHAVWALRGAGVKAVIAKSYARIFFRNAINNGFLAIECPEAVDIVQTGDEVEIDLAAGRLRNLTSGKEASFVPLSDFAREMIEDGGLLPHIQKKAAKA